MIKSRISQGAGRNNPTRIPNILDGGARVICHNFQVAHGAEDS
jgi:hypothetical protein